MIRAFIFDMGGTLEDVFHSGETNRSTGEKLLAYLSAHGMRFCVDPEEFLSGIEAQSRQYRAWSMEELRELTPFEIWSQWYLRGYALQEDRLRVIANSLADIWERNYYSRALRPETPELLEALKGKGYRLGVISNTSCQTQVIEILYEYKIRHYFDTVCLSSLSGFRKPKAELFHAAAADLGVLPHECVYVGDTISRDVRGARLANYGASVRIVSKLTKASDALYIRDDAEEADYLVENLLEMLNFSWDYTNPH